MRRMMVCLLLSGLLVLPVRAAEERRYVALTFDDGPSGKYTQRLLDGLALRGVKATFFLCGYRMEQYPELTERIWEEGHEIGYHGFSHKPMGEMSRKTIGAELADSKALLPEGCAPKLFRPPGGLVTDGIRQVAQVRNLALMSWSVDPKDWATEDIPSIEKAVLGRIRDGDVVLLHDMSLSSVKAALDIVDILQEQGFRFVTVSELAKRRDIRFKPGQIYQSFYKKDES